MNDPDRFKKLFDAIEQGPPPEWVRKMHEHHQRTGTYRASDIRRLIGCPTEGVKFESNPDPASYYTPKD